MVAEIDTTLFQLVVALYEVVKDRDALRARLLELEAELEAARVRPAAKFKKAVDA